MTPRLRDIVTVAVVGLLAVFAAWGWMRKPAPAGTQGANYAAAQPSPAQATPYDSNVQPSAGQTYSSQPYANNAGYAQPVLSNGTYSYAGNGAAPAPCVTPAMYYSSDIPAYASRGYVRTVRARPVAETHYVEANRAAPVHYYTERSKKKSAMIVAGGAGAGAAIGALAGGGKGAGIGALAGGAGAFIYDRLTHRHQVQ